MKRKREVAESELSVLRVLWQCTDGATVRDIVLAMYGRHEHSLHAGVKSFLDRLIEKGYVRADNQGFAHRFHATVTCKEYVGWQLQQLAANHFGGSLTPILQSLIEQVQLRPQDRAVIEEIIKNMPD